MGQFVYKHFPLDRGTGRSNHIVLTTRITGPSTSLTHLNLDTTAWSHIKTSLYSIVATEALILYQVSYVL
jgi:hypothetical protein